MNEQSKNQLEPGNRSLISPQSAAVPGRSIVKWTGQWNVPWIGGSQLLRPRTGALREGSEEWPSVSGDCGIRRVARVSSRGRPA